MITFKQVDADRRNIHRQRSGTPSRYAELFDALLAGKTVEVGLTTKQMNRMRSAWSNATRTKGFSLHAVMDGATYVAWADKRD